MIPDYWQSTESIAKELLRLLQTPTVSKRQIAGLWKLTGPQNWANRFMFKPNYREIIAHYDNFAAQELLSK